MGMTRVLICTMALLAAPLLFAQAPPAAAFDVRHRLDFAANPPDLTFTLRTTSGQKEFHPGERIPITLEFSSSTTDKYRLNGATYDRSGRLPTEEFVMDRRDAVDPLVDYFGSGVMGGAAGGIRGEPVLGYEPHRINLVLNDWFWFDKPGRYRLYLKSHRLTRDRLPTEPGEGLIYFAAVSNILEMDISSPDPAWEEAKLAELRAVLDPAGRPAAKQNRPFHFHTWEHEPKVIEAHRELRYLGTPGAVRLMMDLARRDLNDLDDFGLTGSPHRSMVISELDRYIADPDTLVVQWVIRFRTLFDYVAKASPKPIPMYRWQYEGGDWEKLRTEVESRHKQFEAMVRRRAIELIPVMAQKSESVREECAEAIAALAPEEAKAAGLVPPDDYGMTRAELIAHFDQFPEKQQLALLSDKWGLVRGPDMLPALRRVVEKAPPPPPAEKPYEYERRRFSPGILSEIALQHMQEYAPDEVRQI